MKKQLFILLSLAILAYGQLITDGRDGTKYKTTVIGKQLWMAENLNYKTGTSKCYGEGGQTVNSDLTKNTLSAKEIQANCDKYGRLYDWETAKPSCPKGWHLPSTVEWETLTSMVDDKKAIAKYLKATSGWNTYEGKSTNGIDKFGFAALPGGYGYPDSSFYNAGSYGLWWSATEYDSSSAYYWNIYYELDITGWGNSPKTGHLYSVRCVKN